MNTPPLSTSPSGRTATVRAAGASTVPDPPSRTQVPSMARASRKVVFGAKSTVQGGQKGSLAKASWAQRRKSFSLGSGVRTVELVVNRNDWEMWAMNMLPLVSCCYSVCVLVAPHSRGSSNIR